jgi:hypothetical protein
MLDKMEYWNNGTKKQENQFHCSGNHFQPILPVFQSSNVPELKNITNRFSNQPIRHPGLKPAVGSGLILRGAFTAI